MTFEEWKDGYGLVLEPNYSKETEADCLAAFNFGKRESADLIERQAVQIEMMREALRELIEFELLDAGVQSSDELCFEFREAVKAYNQTTPDQALEQFTERVREQCAKVCDTADKSTHPADLANAIRAIKKLP